jgi:hypothetical protein
MRPKGTCVTSARAIAATAGLSVFLGATPTLAAEQIYIHSVVHPFYGDIGTLTATIDRSPEQTRSNWRLRIAVKTLGIVVSRQESDTTEIMHGDRLFMLRSVSNKDGRHFQVHGDVHGDQFVATATAGSFAGPATILPSDPWALSRTSRNQEGNASPSVVRANLDDPPIHIRPVCVAAWHTIQP